MTLSIGQIDKLGNRLRENADPTQEDLDFLQEYRKSYSAALPYIFEALRKSAIRIDNHAILTFRIKRINTIINKLRRFDNKDGNGDMRLSRMWDIAGCRCILSSSDNNKIFKLADSLIKKSDIVERRSANDYVTEPKADGYRSYHMYVMKEGSGKPIEVQIRNKEMHNWATLVEIFDILYGLGIKEGNKRNMQQDFLFLFSRKNELSNAESIQLIKIENRLHIFRDMCQMFSKNYALVREQWAVRKRGDNYLVLEAGKGFKTSIDAFSSFAEAEDNYYKKYLQRRNTNLVLVYSKSSDFNDISFAYSNYILSVHSFFFDYKKIIEESILFATQGNDTMRILHLMKVYKKTLLLYFDCVHDEISALKATIHQSSDQKVYEIEWNHDLGKELRMWQDSVLVFTRKLNRSVNHMNNSRFHNWLFMLYFKQLNMAISRKMK